MLHPVSEDVMRLERIAATFRQLPLTLSVTVINAVLAAVVLQPVVPRTGLLAWVLAVTLQAVVRFALLLRYWHSPSAVQAAPAWESVAVVGALISGSLWGVLGAVLAPSHSAYLLFAALVVGGMCAGAATVSSTHLASVIAFVLPAVLPLGARFACEGTTQGAVLAIIAAIFAASLVLAAWRSSALFSDSVRMRWSLARQARELEQANERLRAEMHERRQTEAALRQSQKMEAIGSLTAGIAHDFNNLLMVVTGSAELLQQRLAADPKASVQVAAILRASERGSQMTRRLLAFGRKETLNPAVVDVAAALRNAATLLGGTLGAQVRVLVDLPAELWPAYVDQHEIERAIINLAINARDAMPGGGTLTLGAANVVLHADGEVDDLPAGDYVAIEARDSGTGMTEEVRARAFDPFFTTKPAGAGSGLGLSQVYGLIKQSGGATQIESSPGHGTTVRLLLPRAPVVAEPALRPSYPGRPVR